MNTTGVRGAANTQVNGSVCVCMCVGGRLPSSERLRENIFILLCTRERTRCSIVVVFVVDDGGGGKEDGHNRNNYRDSRNVLSSYRAVRETEEIPTVLLSNGVRAVAFCRYAFSKIPVKSQLSTAIPYHTRDFTRANRINTTAENRVIDKRTGDVGIRIYI